MGMRRRTVEEIITKLREAEVGLAQGETVGQVCRQLGVSEQTSTGGVVSTADCGWTRRNASNSWKQRTLVCGEQCRT